jgi:hypothetical protein
VLGAAWRDTKGPLEGPAFMGVVAHLPAASEFPRRFARQHFERDHPLLDQNFDQVLEDPDELAILFIENLVYDVL